MSAYLTRSIDQAQLLWSHAHGDITLCANKYRATAICDSGAGINLNRILSLST